MFESPQKTIQSSIHIQGKGLHSGIEGNLQNDMEGLKEEVHQFHPLG